MSKILKSIVAITMALLMATPAFAIPSGGAGSANTEIFPRDIAILTTNSNQIKVGHTAGTAMTIDVDATGNVIMSLQDEDYTLVFGDNDALGIEQTWFHDSSSPADGDASAFYFDFNNSIGTQTHFSSIVPELQDPTNSTEQGILIFSAMSTGSFDEFFRLDGTTGVDGVVFTKVGSFDDLIIGGSFALTPSGDQTMLDDGAIDCSTGIARVVADGIGGALLDTDPAISDGAYDGQICIVEGTSDANKVTIVDGVNTALDGGVSALFENLDNMTFMWDLGESLWIETGRVLGL